MRPSRIVLLWFALVCGGTRVWGQSCPLNPQGGPNAVTFTGKGDGSDIDLGTSGDYHNFRISRASAATLCLDQCDGTTDPVCRVTGGNISVDNVAFGPPIPVHSSTAGVCVLVRFTRAPEGTANVQTGDVDITLGLKAEAYVGFGAPVDICPRCSGTGLGGAGVCSSGARQGQACTVDDIVDVRRSGGVVDNYKLSRSCLPAGSPFGTVQINAALETGTATLSGTKPCAGQAGDDACGGGNLCTGACSANANRGGISNQCCSNSAGKACFPSGSTLGKIERVGTPASPAPAWPDPTYPKSVDETLVGTFCGSSTGNILVDASVGAPGPIAMVLPATGTWSGNAAPGTTTSTSTVPPSTTSTSTLPPGTTSTSTVPPSTTTTSTLPGATTTTSIPAGTTTTSTVAGSTTTSTSLPSGPTTTTSMPPSTTTTSTLPVCSPAACADDDPCTDDDCVNNQCSNVQRPGAPGVSCSLGKLVGAAFCGSETIDPALRSFIDGRIGKARTQLDKIVDGTKAKVLARLRKAAIAALAPIGKRAAKSAKAKKITSTCAQTIKSQSKAAQQSIQGIRP